MINIMKKEKDDETEKSYKISVQDMPDNQAGNWCFYLNFLNINEINWSQRYKKKRISEVVDLRTFVNDCFNRFVYSGTNNINISLNETRYPPHDCVCYLFIIHLREREYNVLVALPCQTIQKTYCSISQSPNHIQTQPHTKITPQGTWTLTLCSVRSNCCETSKEPSFIQNVVVAGTMTYP